MRLLTPTRPESQYYGQLFWHLGPVAWAITPCDYLLPVDGGQPVALHSCYVAELWAEFGSYKHLIYLDLFPPEKACAPARKGA